MAHLSDTLRRLTDKLNGLRHHNSTRTGDSFYPKELIDPPEAIAPFVPTPIDVVKRMLELADVKPGKVLYDLGSGDGRVVHIAAQQFKAKAVGIELYKNLIERSNREAEKLGLSGAVKFIMGDIFDVDLSPADIVTMYLLTDANERIREKLESELRHGSKVVTHDFPMTNWRYTAMINYTGETGNHILYLYIIGDAERS